MNEGILFLCTGNACRSQMAEGFARALLPPGIWVASAGTHPASVHPRAVTVMAELGIDISAHYSKPVEALDVPESGTVYTLCGDAAENCPALPGLTVEHWPLRDPAKATGTDAEIFSEFRVIRDDIFRRISALAAGLAREPALGVIGGSGFYDLPGLTDVRKFRVTTPFGEPSGPLIEGRLGNRRVVFLARHGEGHRLLPAEVNTRANIYALKWAGVSRLVSVSAVGSLREHIAPGDVVTPTQFLDRTSGRPATFFGGGVVAHVSLADPVCQELAEVLATSSRDEGANTHDSGTYICIEGPQFSTRAESAQWRSMGADVVGMTNLPEARLAREAELCYATLALPTDYDCWRPNDEVQVSDLIAMLMANVDRGRAIIATAFAALDTGPCKCQGVLDNALMTPVEAIETQAHVRLHALLARRLSSS